MGKKNKKKTIASTRKNFDENSGDEKPAKKEKRKILKKLLSRNPLGKKAKNQEKKVSEEKPEISEEEMILAATEMEEPIAQSPKQKQKIKGGILMMIGAFTLLFIGYFLFAYYSSP